MQACDMSTANRSYIKFEFLTLCDFKRPSVYTVTVVESPLHRPDHLVS